MYIIAAIISKTWSRSASTVLTVSSVYIYIYIYVCVCVCVCVMAFDLVSETYIIRFMSEWQKL